MSSRVAQLDPEPIVVERQGNFVVGGEIVSDPSDTYRTDHAYVQFQVPPRARPLPLVFWHGGSTCGSGWESTPDGREGFQTLLLRRGFATYVLDRPRKGRAGTSPTTGTAGFGPFGDRRAWNIWRLGVWDPPSPPTIFPSLQMATDERTIDQFLRQRTPETGPGDAPMVVALDAVDALMDELGRCILVLHSQGGKYGWLMRTRNERVAGIVAYEPGAFVFPDDDPPAAVPTGVPDVERLTAPILVSRERFQQLAAIPIQLVYGDNIQDEPSSVMGIEFWRVNKQRREQFRRAIGEAGGVVEILDLPEAGIAGNTHFPFADLNNGDIADLFVEFVERNGLG